MKLHRKNRSRSYYRYHRNRVIQRKSKVAKQLGWRVPYAGRFAKGKLHCSCWMCSQKTNRDGYPHAQVMQWERLSSQLADYLDGNET